jgi:hypothetical protein
MPNLARFVLVPGTNDPGGEWSWGGTVPPTERKRLLAAFNSGFRLTDAKGGFYLDGKLVSPLVREAASLVIDQRGAVDVVAWRGGGLPGPEVAAVRQNLQLIVDKGQRVVGLEENREKRWGFKLNQGLYTWRTGAGMTADGALLYLAGDGLTLRSLAEALRLAGAVRAMELDIHDEWSSFNVFQPSADENDHVQGTKLLPSMLSSSRRYLLPDDRDFIAAFVR